MPSVVTVSEFDDTGDNTYEVTMPASIVAGNKLFGLVICIGDETQQINTPAGYTVVFTSTSGEQVIKGIMKVADGLEGATQTITIVNNGRFVARFWQLNDAKDPAVALPDYDVSFQSSTDTPDPASVTPVAGLGDYLTIAAVSFYASGPDVSSFPANYINTVFIETSNIGNDLRLACADRAQTGITSEDPGPFPMSNSRNCVVYTIMFATDAVQAQLTASQTETGDATSSSIETIVGVLASVSETGDTAVSSIEVILQIGSSQTEEETTQASFNNVVSISSSKVELGDSQAASLGLTFVSNISADQEEQETQSANISNVIQITASQLESESQAANFGLLAVAHIQADHTEQETTQAEINNIVSIGSNVLEKGDSQTAGFGLIARAHISASQEESDSQNASIKNVVQISASKEETETQEASINIVVNISANKIEDNEAQSALLSVKDKEGISAEIIELGDTTQARITPKETPVRVTAKVFINDRLGIAN